LVVWFQFGYVPSTHTHTHCTHTFGLVCPLVHPLVPTHYSSHLYTGYSYLFTRLPHTHVTHGLRLHIPQFGLPHTVPTRTYLHGYHHTHYTRFVTHLFTSLVVAVGGSVWLFVCLRLRLLVCVPVVCLRLRCVYVCVYVPFGGRYYGCPLGVSLRFPVDLPLHTHTSSGLVYHTFGSHTLGYLRFILVTLHAHFAVGYLAFGLVG